MTAITGVAVAVTLVVGAGIVPAYMASAQVAEVGSGNNPGGGILQPAAEQPKAEELREPSGLGAVEAKASGVRKPTVVKPKPAPKPAPPKQQTPATSTASTAGWKSAKVSWYGPGFYGNTMAGGGKLTPSSMVVAHRTLPFGTKIEFSYKGRTCVAVVQDRGPHVAGRIFDLGPGTAGALGFSGVGTVQYRIVSN
jgi:rare lipoprotein A (peptidoglycan hydrolase)